MRYFMCCTKRSGRSHEALIRQGRDLVTYAIINAVAMRKISKKYDKVYNPLHSTVILFFILYTSYLKYQLSFFIHHR